jgi:hypothetical protein
MLTTKFEICSYCTFVVTKGGHDCLVDITTRLRAKRSRILILAGAKEFPLLQNVHNSLGPPSLPIKVHQGVSPGVKRPGRDINH